jgi:hypothetical protein
MIGGVHSSRYDKRSGFANGITMFGADGERNAVHKVRMLGSKELLATLGRLRDEGRTSNADIARLLDLPTSRIAEIFAGSRRVTIDEMKVLVEHFGLEAASLAPSAENLEPLLDALLPLAPPGKMTEQSRKALAEALSHGLGLLGSQFANRASSDALAVAARAAALRFRETAAT